MPRPEIPRRITASASSIRVTAVRACRRVRNCPIGTTSAAAHRGHVDSIFELAFQHERGIGTEANTDHALAYYRVAAAENHLNAQYNLAVLLSRGGDVKPDLREAFFWAAAARNNARIRPRGELTLEKVSRLAQMIRERLPHQTASKAGLAATRLTGQPI